MIRQRFWHQRCYNKFSAATTRSDLTGVCCVIQCSSTHSEISLVYNPAVFVLLRFAFQQGQKNVYFVETVGYCGVAPPTVKSHWSTVPLHMRFVLIDCFDF